VVKLDETLDKLYYDPKGARNALGISLEKFNYWVELGVIQPTTLPHLKHRVFARSHIDALGRHLEALLLAAAKEHLEFRPATVEDIAKENELAFLVFGEAAKNPDTMLARRQFLETNPNMTYHLYERGLLVASINLVPLAHWAIEEFKEGRRGWTFPLTAIEQFEPGIPLECIIIDMMTNPSVPHAQRTGYGMQLLSGMAEVLENWGARGIEIARILSSGGTKQGKQLLETAGFVFLGNRGGSRNIYELEIARATIKLLGGYKEALARYKQS
jgi:hypothetical protein